MVTVCKRMWNISELVRFLLLWPNTGRKQVRKEEFQFVANWLYYFGSEEKDSTKAKEILEEDTDLA